MSKKPRVRTLMGSQHVKGSRTLPHFVQQYLCHIFWPVWNKNSSKNSAFVLSEILRLFVNILTPDGKYSLSKNASVSRNQFKCNYPEITNFFPNFLLHFRNLHKFSNTLEKEMSMRDYLFLKLETVKSGVT